MNRLLRLLQRFRRVDRGELESRQRSSADLQRGPAGRAGLSARLRGVLRRREAGRAVAGEAVAAGDDARFEASYTVFWLKKAREWDAGQRQAVVVALERVVTAREFTPTLTERRFRVEGLDENQTYSGASLLALRKVLRALDATGSGERASR